MIEPMIKAREGCLKQLEKSLVTLTIIISKFYSTMSHHKAFSYSDSKSVTTVVLLL